MQIIVTLRKNKLKSQENCGMYCFILATITSEANNTVDGAPKSMKVSVKAKLIRSHS